MRKRIIAIIMALSVFISLFIMPGEVAFAATPYYTNPTYDRYTVIKGNKVKIDFTLCCNYCDYFELFFQLTDSEGYVVFSESTGILYNYPYQHSYDFTFPIDTSTLELNDYTLWAGIDYYADGWWTGKSKTIRISVYDGDVNNTVYNGIDYSAVYDFQTYMVYNSDLKKLYHHSPKKALRHFVEYGMKEGRRANIDFVIKNYKNRYSDLRILYGNDLKKYYLHYINSGKKEGRNAFSYSEINNPVTILNGVDYSKVYDYNYYICHNIDINQCYGNDDVATLNHFVQCGMKEGRQGNESFDVKSYKNANPDLRSHFGNDLSKYYIHYMNYGYKENRVCKGVPTPQGAVTVLNGVDYSKVYDYDYYISKNPDIKKAFGNDDVAVLKHFVNYGMKEGRQSKATFDLKSYKNAYSDLRRNFGDNNKAYYMHYINSGYKEKRVATGVTKVQNPITVLNGVDYSKVYDYEYYINHNSDIKRIYGNNDIGALKHFINYGMKEGRQGSADFNVSKYKARYADLRRNFGNDNKKYYLHYITNGYKEHRDAK